MAPIRRYLRITKYSVLEVRIYLHKPSDASWLLSTHTNALPRIINTIRPKVLPKLREENENARNKSARKKKKGGIKDVAEGEDFEVSIFLKETSTRHSLLSKGKKVREKGRIQSNSEKLTGWLREKGDGKENAIKIGEDEEIPVGILREEGDNDDVVDLSKIPEVENAAVGTKRKLPAAGIPPDDDDALFVSSSDEEFFATQNATGTQRTAKRRKQDSSGQGQKEVDVVEEEQDDKKKLMVDTSYDGFSIYGRILCLIVTRKNKKEPASGPMGSSQMMEQWIGTQAAQEAGLLDDDDG